MTFQKAIPDDDCQSSTSINSLKTTTPIVPTKNTHGNVLSHPLYTPIQPNEPCFSHPDNFRSTVDAQLHIEEASTTALIHATCRLKEALAVTTDTFQQLVHRWTGLEPQDAANAALLVEIPVHTPEDIDKYLLQEQKGIMLQILLQATQLLARAAGIKAGIAIDARALAVAHGLLLPLSAFDSEHVRSIFFEFTGGATMANAKESIANIQQTLSAISSPLFNSLMSSSGRKFGIFILFDEGLKRQVYDKCSTAYHSVRSVNDTITKAVTATTMKQHKTERNTVTESEPDALARQAIRDMVNSALSSTIEETATSALYAVQLASAMKKWRQPLSAMLRSLVPLVFIRQNNSINDCDLLERALNACQQAVDAARIARRHAAHHIV